jgi:cytochrome c-type biogenesis protein CcmE
MSSAAGLILYALRQNVDLYYTPSQLMALGQVRAHDVRLGGLVVKGSVKKIPETLKIYFTLTDGHQNIEVRYDGILPALFREGQGIVAQGQLNNFGIFVADQVLAKHDSNYKPPEIK